MSLKIKTVVIPVPLTELEEVITVMYKQPSISFGIPAKLISIQLDHKPIKKLLIPEVLDRIEAAILEIELG